MKVPTLPTTPSLLVKRFAMGLTAQEVTPRKLTRVAGLAAVAAGLLFIGVQINHPHLDATSITTTEMAIRDSLKVLMAVLALVGITGMYLRQVQQTGVLGFVGYVVLATGYLLIMNTAFIAGYVLPSIAGTSRGYVDDVLAAATTGSATGNIGLMNTAINLQGTAYLAGGLLFGIALYRARILARWAAVLLAVGGIVTVVLSVMPNAFYRLLAFPNGIAMIALGLSLWREQRPQGAVVAASPVGSPLDPVGAR
jgi:hypothetical protein